MLAAKSAVVDSLWVDGFAIVEDVVLQECIDRQIAALERVVGGDDLRRRDDQVYAGRNILQFSPDIQDLAASRSIRQLVDAVLGPAARPVRGVLFDKNPSANWKVPWHQDLTIAVKKRIDVPGFGPWSIKTGIPNVRPPAEILEQMLTVRVHLDDCFNENGPLRVLPGTHLHGILSGDQIADWRASTPAIPCHVARGGIVMMRLLVLHASSAALKPARRRVIHLEYAAGDLPGGLEWAHIHNHEVD